MSNHYRKSRINLISSLAALTIFAVLAGLVYLFTGDGNWSEWSEFLRRPIGQQTTATVLSLVIFAWLLLGRSD